MDLFFVLNPQSPKNVFNLTLNRDVQFSMQQQEIKYDWLEKCSLLFSTIKALKAVCIVKQL